MIKTLTLKNFRCFDEHVIELPHKALLIGKNNAGKSTCVEALRLISLVTEKLGSLRYSDPPKRAGLRTDDTGVSLSLDSITIHKDCLFYRYGAAPGLVSAEFTNGTKLDVHIGDELYVHAVVFNRHGRVMTSRSEARYADIPRVSILPQIGPLLDEE